MIRLTRNNPSPFELVVRIDGRLTAESLPEFRGLLDAEPCPSRVTLDLAGLTSVDTEGRGYLLGLRDAGCRLVGASLYINRLLEEV